MIPIMQSAECGWDLSAWLCGSNIILEDIFFIETKYRSLNFIILHLSSFIYNCNLNKSHLLRAFDSIITVAAQRRHTICLFVQMFNWRTMIAQSSPHLNNHLYTYIYIHVNATPPFPSSCEWRKVESACEIYKNLLSDNESAHQYLLGRANCFLQS